MKYFTHFLRRRTWLPAGLLLLAVAVGVPAEAQVGSATSRIRNRIRRRPQSDGKSAVQRREQARYLQNLRRDEREVRRKLKRWRSLCRGTEGFVGGKTDDTQRRAFALLFGEVGHVSNIAALLSEQVPELNARDFQPRTFCGIVAADGSLLPAPGLLRRESTRTFYGDFKEQWNEIVTALKAEKALSSDQTTVLGEALLDWKATVERTPAFRKSRGSAGAIAAHQYFESAEKLTRRLRLPEERKALCGFLKEGGYPFPGGTLGELSQHVIRNDLSVRPGSPAQLALSRLSHEMLQEARAEIAVLEDRVEYYKRHSPAYVDNNKRGRYRSSKKVADFPGLPRREYAEPTGQRQAMPAKARPADSTGEEKLAGPLRRN